jgi:hypothetical protein
MTTRRIGERPSAYEIALEALTIARALAERLESVEVKLGGNEDGPAPEPLPPNFVPIAEAADAAGFAGESGVRAAIKRAQRTGDRPWWRRAGSRIYVDVDRCPRCR